MGGDILHNIFLKYDLIFLNINECKKHFNVGSTFCYYIIKKSITKDLETNVISEYNKNISESIIKFKDYYSLKFLPIHITNDTLELIKGITLKEPKLKISRIRKLDTSHKKSKDKMKLVKDDTFKYITYHTTKKTYYSNIKLDIFDDYKVLLNMSGYIKPIIKKNCNITESKFYITVSNEKEGIEIVNILNDERIEKYLKLCKYSGFNSRKVLENIPTAI